MLPVNTSVRLNSGEVAYLEGWARFGQYFGTDWSYTHSNFVAAGGLGLLALTAGLSAMGNSRRRQEAIAQAAPQWRALGTVPVVATNLRLLGCDQGRWLSWWYGDIRQLVPDLPKQHRIDLLFERSRPTRFEGGCVAVLAVVLTQLLYGQTLSWTHDAQPRGQLVGPITA